MRYLLILLVCWAGAVGASTNATWCPDNRLLDAVCQIESSGGRFVWGDGGRSLGYFQIQKAAWTDVSKWRKNRNLPVYDYRENVSNPHLNRIYAADYFTILHASLEVQYRRKPTEGELYAAYNMGLTNFKKCNYSLPNVNPVTRAKCHEIAELVQASSKQSVTNAVSATTPKSAQKTPCREFASSN